MAAEPPVLPGAEEARRWAAEELAKPEYREAAPSWLQSLWEDFTDWLQSLDGPAEAGSTLPSPVIGIVIAVVVAAAVIIAKPRLNPKARQVHEVFEADSVLTPGDYRQRAEASAVAGKWGDAVVDRFRALVRSAEDRTILDPRPGRTADEAARGLAFPFSGEGQRLRMAAATFDAVRYGSWAAGPRDYEAIVSLDAALEALKPVRSSGQQEQGQQEAGHQGQFPSDPAALP